MTAERSAAYSRAVNKINELAAAKFHNDEAAVLRNAADELLFASAETDETQASVRAVNTLIDNLIESDRLIDTTGNALRADIFACGLSPALV